MDRLKKLAGFSAVIFDMDGLVLDTEATYCIAWQKASEEMGYNFTTAFCLSMSGLHHQDVQRRLTDACGDNFNLKQFADLSGKYWYQYVNQQGIPVKKGFLNILAELKAKNIPFCLATNSPEKNALECLSLANLNGIFNDVITRDHVQQGKPAPDVFLLAAKVLSTPVSQCLVIEDSKTGIQAAVNAGANSVFIPSVLPVDATAVALADYLFSDLDELAQIIH